jgi:uncharacterized protein (DUF2147 family)
MRAHQTAASLGLFLVLAFATHSAAQAQTVAPIEGVWRTALASEVTIAPCPAGFCGYLSKIIVPEGMLSSAEAEAAAAMEVEEFYDERNKDPALRSRPMLGLQILTLRPGERPTVFDEVYNPEDGNSYSGYMEMLGPDLVRLNGCVLFNVVCRGEDWVRVPPEEIDPGAVAPGS